jgi:hypothetical protein
VNSTTLNHGLKPNSPLIYDRQVAEALLAEAMHDPGVVMAAATDLPAQVFLDQEHRTIWSSIRETFESSGTVSPELVANTLIRHQQLSAAGGVDNLIRLAEQAPYAVHFHRHIEILREHFERRQLHDRHSRVAAVAVDLSIDWGDIVEYANLPTITSTTDCEIRTAAQLYETDWTIPPPVIDGLIRRGETANVIAASKTGKSWMTYGLALSVATGRRWLERFDTLRGKVLMIDNELLLPILLHRLAKVAHAMGLERSEWTDRIEILSLRGKLADIHKIRQMAGKRTGIDVVTLDALYRCLPVGTSENDNAQMTAIYNELDAMAAEMNSAIVCVHHASKGQQASKAITDRGAGAGAISRAADAHITIIPHQQPGIVVVEGVPRSFEPFQPFALSWQFPLFQPASDDLDLSAVQGAARSTGARAADREQERDDARRKTADRHDATVLQVLEQKPDVWHTKDQITSEARLNDTNGKAALLRLVAAGKIVERVGRRRNSTIYLLASSLPKVLEQEQREKERLEQEQREQEQRQQEPDQQTADTEKNISAPPTPPEKLSGCREATTASTDAGDDIPTTVGLSDCPNVGNSGRKRTRKAKTTATTTATTTAIVEANGVSVTSVTDIKHDDIPMAQLESDDHATL